MTAVDVVAIVGYIVAIIFLIIILLINAKTSLAYKKEEKKEKELAEECIYWLELNLKKAQYELKQLKEEKQRVESKKEELK